MARKPRFNLPGYPQHVTQRGNNRKPCFFSPRDFQYYLDCLGEACINRECALHAYVLMTNHVHLLITPAKEQGVSLLMQDVGRKYVHYVNRSYGRSGTLWEGRFKASLVDADAYLLVCHRYIESNPIRAGMANSLSDYRWSSYHSNAYGKIDPWFGLTPCIWAWQMTAPRDAVSTAICLVRQSSHPS
jgi:putative transposase